MSGGEVVDFARVENGALAGRFVARFWQPIALSTDLNKGRAKRVKLLGEHYTLYRGQDGAVRMTQDRCPHRGTMLYLGWIEENSIRCRYHGWKFGGTGQGEEFPAETASYAAKICLKTYPTREYLGAIFCYVGEGEAPEFPIFPEAEDESRGELVVEGVFLPYNFFQRIENDHDESHIFFTHKLFFAQYGLTKIPKVTAKETDYGIVVVSTRADGKQRVGYGFMPNILMREVPIPHDRTKMSLLLGWRVPVDDVTTYSLMVFRVGTRYEPPSNGATYEDAAVVVERVMKGEISLDDVDENHPSLPIIQDTVSIGGQGQIADRSDEHLGVSDKGVAMLRRAWARELRAIEDGGPLKTFKRPVDFSFGKEIEGNYFNKIDDLEDPARIEGAALV
jgi:5,5'-dehydrodivanillate O-demethylase